MQPKLIAFALAGLLTVTGLGRSLTAADTALAGYSQSQRQSADISAAVVSASAAENYRINAGRSRFMARVGSGGILWFLGHVHHIAMRDFTGAAQITPGTITPASLEITIKAKSLEETGPKFTEQQKQTINNTMRKQVLETDEYPEIIFKSTEITAEKVAGNQYKATIRGDLTLHGVTGHISIPALVSFDHDALHATGEFSVKRSDYKVKTHSIKGGAIRVRNKITFEFDIAADRA